MNMASDILVGSVAPTVARRMTWSWVGYGLAAYVGLRLMRRFGIFEPQADKAIRLIDRNAKQMVGRFVPIAREHESHGATV